MTDHSSLLKEKNNSDIVERLNHFCTDWDGSAMNDHTTPMDGLHCIELREAAAEITRLRAEAEALRKDKAMLREALSAICDELLDDDAFSATQIARHAGRAAIAATTESETKEQQA